MARYRKLVFRHIHECPHCHERCECWNRVPYLECAESDWCAEHSSLNTKDVEG